MLSIVREAESIDPVKVELFCKVAAIELVLSQIRLPLRDSPSAIKVTAAELNEFTIFPVL